MSSSLESHFSRRTFLGATAAAAASLATGALFAQSNPGQNKLGFALVGVGSLTMNQLLPAFAKCKFAKPVALVSGHPVKARQQADKYGINPKNIYNYDNYDTMKDNPDIDVVYVVLPNSMHKEYTIRAAAAGKHVLCEKPMAVSVEECQAMIDACNSAKRKLMIAYRMHYEPMTIKAIELAHSDADIGTIKQITAEAGFNMGNPAQWRCHRPLAGGGSLMDMGIYALNAVRYLSGQEPSEITAVSYSTPNDPRFTDIEETISFELKFDSGIVASVLSTYGFGCGRFRLYGTKGQLEAEPFQSYTGNHLYLTRGRGRAEVQYQPVNHFATEMDDFCQCIMSDTTSRTPGEEGLKDIRIMMAAYESAQSGKAVKLA
ncbi:MAG: Gfo/Idh/MocA family oxidoreductase [Tepidisphaeraceae bacterium]|jgi:predicted dehydrogenase